MNQQRVFGKLVGITGFLGVALGAFGAHGLEGVLSDEMLKIYQTGVLYHLIHSAALLSLVCANQKLWTSPWISRICIAWLAGIMIFSGSLYVLATTGIKILGAITPVGGIAFLLGWAMVTKIIKFVP